MFNLHLTADQINFRDTIRSFAMNEIRPAAIDPKRLEPFAKPLLRDCLEKATELGLRTLLLSENAGGVGADIMTACIVFEELAAGDVDVAIALSETALIGSFLFDSWMEENQRENFLQRFIEEDDFHLSYAGLTPDVSNGWSYHQDINENSNVGLTAVRRDNHWVINGSVSHVSNAPIAELLIVMADSISKQSDSNGANLFMLPRDTAGLTIEESSGNSQSSEIVWRHGCSANLEFDSCKIPLEYTLNMEVKKPVIDKTYGRFSALLNAAINLGLGRAAFDAAVDYAKIRRQGGRNIVEHQAIGKKIADMAIKLELASTFIYKAAWVADHPEVIADSSVSDLPHHIIASVFTAEAIHEVALIAAECFGAMGVMRDMPIQKYVNDSFLFLHSDVSDIASKLPIAEMVVNYQRVEAA